jgi:uncharacterized repeat protein (TIGR01451 family)
LRSHESVAGRWGRFAAQGQRSRDCLAVIATILVAGTLLGGFPRAALAQTPAAAYGFDEGTGATAADSSGNGLTGALTNGATWSAGQYNSGVRLDGVNDHVNLGNPTALQMTGSMTISAWINSSAFPPDDAAIVSKRGSNGFQLDTTLDGGPRTIGFKLTSSSGGLMARFGATALQSNVWYHVAGVYDAAAKTLNVYLNGQLDNGGSSGAVTATQENSTENVQVGQRPGSPGWFNFAGTIDQVRIYNVALTAAQIQADMNAPIGQQVPDLTLTKTHVGNFARGQTAATYAITVRNVGAASSGPVTVNDTVPTGLTATGIAGTGWSCAQPAGPCSRADALGAGGSYPPITLTVDVGAAAPASVTNTAAVSGGGDANAANNTANDPTTIAAPGSVPAARAQYSFDEGSGTSAADTSGNGLTGALTNGPTWSAGKYGSGVRFDGVNDFVSLGNPTALQLTGSMTISAWINSSSFPPDDAAIVSKRGGSGYQLDTTLDTGPRTIGFKLTTSSGGLMARFGATALQPNIWYHVAGVYDATAQTLNVYLNGQLNNGGSSGTVTATQQNSTNNVQIGQRPGSPGTFNFAGTIDQVRIYNVALTAAQIQADMNTPAGGGGADTTPPSAPGTLSASAASSMQINLSWGAATDNVAVTGYRVERCSGTSCASFAEVAQPTGTSFNDTGLAASTPYSYRVRAADAAGNLGAFSNTSSATTQAALDTQAPTAPSSLSATASSSSQVDLLWTASTDNVGVTGYGLERCQGAGCTSFAEVATPSGTTYSDIGLTGSTSYSYRVRARDAANNQSSYSNTAITVTQAAADTTPPTAPGALTASAVSSSEIDLSWGPATDDVAVTGYRVERCQGTGCTSFTQVATPSGTTFSDTGRAAATSYSYRVRAADAAGNLGAFSNTASATTPAGVSGGTFQNEILITGMNLPTALRFLPNGDMLILELGGKIWLVPAGTTTVSATPFLSLTNIGGGYQGLMDLTLDPDFEHNHYYYVFYTLGSPNRDRVARFTVTDDHTGTVPGSEFLVYEDPQDAGPEHHGGALNFGGDGKLYVTTGEHFEGSDAQRLTSPRGKILRINADGSVPTDNPFYDGAGPNRDDVWALGLRNPFRAFYDGVSGRLYVADVGGNDYSTAQEEVHLGEAGANFGWPNCEGSSCEGNPTYTNPIYSYPHLGRDASITGGFIYRGNQFPPEYYGNYFFADYSQNWIRRLTFDASGNVSGVFAFEPPDGSADGPYGDIVDLREGPDGALYYVDLGFSDTTGETGISKIRRIGFIRGDLPPTAAAAATPTEGTTAPLTVTFSSTGSADPEGEPLSYLWTFGDGATSDVPNPTHTYASLGAYTAQLTVFDGTSSAASAPVQITVGNKPVPAIASPSDSSFFRGGDAIAIMGDASDVEDGALPTSAFSWTVDFLHSGHVHPGVPTTGTKSFVFPIATTGHDFSGDTRYRITLTVTDSNGLKASRSVTIYPEKVDLSFDTVPSGLVIEIDGLPHTTPYVHDTLVNFSHTIAAPNQTVSGAANTFASWSDGGAQQHTIVVPAVDQSYTATYTVTTPQFPPGLVAGYRLDEGAGSITADLSGNNATGTLVDAPTWTTGRYNGALNFDGTSYVDLGNPVPLQLTGSMTLSAWINISANPGDDGAIVAKLGGAGWQLKTSPDTGPRTAAIQISSNGSDAIQRYSASVLTSGNWYHLAGVYDAAAQTLEIYVNGALDNGALSGTVPAAQFDAPFNVNIAQRTGLPGNFNFLGRIDEVHIFNRALTASEIQTDMNLPR